MIEDCTIYREVKVTDAGGHTTVIEHEYLAQIRWACGGEPSVYGIYGETFEFGEWRIRPKGQVKSQHQPKQSPMVSFIELKVERSSDLLVSSPKAGEIMLGMESHGMDVAIRIPKELVADLVKELLEQSS